MGGPEFREFKNTSIHGKAMIDLLFCIILPTMTITALKADKERNLPLVYDPEIFKEVAEESNLDLSFKLNQALSKPGNRNKLPTETPYSYANQIKVLHAVRARIEPEKEFQRNVSLALIEAGFSVAEAIYRGTSKVQDIVKHLSTISSVLTNPDFVFHLASSFWDLSDQNIQEDKSHHRYNLLNFIDESK